jgi:hypothetical protein
MPDYVLTSDPPWYSLRAGIVSVVINEGIEHIGNTAFYEYNSLTSVTIPNSVKSIGNTAFSRCFGITSVTIPNSVISIGDRAFAGCTNLAAVHVSWSSPNAVTLGSNVFSNIKNGAKLYVPKVSLVAYRASFQWRTYFETTNIDEGSETTWTLIGGTLTISGECPMPNYSNGVAPWYSQRSNITSIVIHNVVTSIGSYAFYGCTNLTAITIPNSVISIGNFAFYKCIGLTEITIPNSIVIIGFGAFYSCSNLAAVHVSWSNPSAVMLSGNGFSNINSDAKLYVPNASLAAYQVSSQWRDFKVKNMIGE